MVTKSNIPSRTQWDYVDCSAGYVPKDLLYDTDLTLDAALAKIDEANRHNYEAVYHWFIRNTESGNSIGSREYGRGQRLPGVDSDFAHAAQRGIHVPSKQKYAATVTITRNSLYGTSNSDGGRVLLGDGTWVLNYAAHRNNTGGETLQTWNNGLFNCFYDGIPVGVFIEDESGSGRYYRALAFVEGYNPSTDCFLLHGPVTSANSECFQSPEKSDAALAEEPNIEDLQKDQRIFVTSRRAARKGQEKFRAQLMDAYNGQCAISQCGVEDVLQAAHIIDYRGTQSNIVSNGMLLRVDLHLLYDNYLLSVNPDDFKVVLHPDLEGTNYEQFGDKEIFIPREKNLRPNEQLLGLNYETFKSNLPN